MQGNTVKRTKEGSKNTENHRKQERMAIHRGTGHAENETYNNKKGSKERSWQKYCFWMKSFKL